MRLIAVIALLAAGCGEAQAAEWRTLRPAPLERTEVAAARIGNAIYVAGGFVPDRSSSRAVERYDIRANRWRQVRPMPVGLNHAAIAVHDGKLYVVGGYAGNLPTARQVPVVREESRIPRRASDDREAKAGSGDATGNRGTISPSPGGRLA